MKGRWCSVSGFAVMAVSQKGAVDASRGWTVALPKPRKDAYSAVLFWSQGAFDDRVCPWAVCSQKCLPDERHCHYDISLCAKCNRFWKKLRLLNYLSFLQCWSVSAIEKASCDSAGVREQRKRRARAFSSRARLRCRSTSASGLSALSRILICGLCVRAAQCAAAVLRHVIGLFGFSHRRLSFRVQDFPVGWRVAQVWHIHQFAVFEG